MSGIFGFFDLKMDHVSEHKDLIHRMSCWNKAYGSLHDVYDSEALSMGGFLEKLNDNLRNSNPVLKNENQIAVIDAILYNREELVALLGSEYAVDISDEELLLEYLNEFGFDALKNVNGDFAGAIYEIQKKKLVLFRDHMGVRPLFYYMKDGFFAFSTDIRGLTAIPFLDATISDRWISFLMEGCAIDGLENTEYKNIFCVKPACYLSISSKDKSLSLTNNAYWVIGTNQIRLKSDEAYQKQLRSLVEDSVKRRLSAISGRVGAELSGGLDSGVIDILINRMGRECIYYSWSTSPEELELVENDERKIINDICEQEHITCNYGHLIADKESLIDSKTRKAGIKIDYDDEIALRLAMPPYINALTIVRTSEFINENGGKVVFSGHGGDEGVSHRCNPYELLHYKEFYHYIKQIFSTTTGEKYRVLRTLKLCRSNLIFAKRKYKNVKSRKLNSRILFKNDFWGRFDDEMPLPYFAFDPIKYIKNGGSRSRLDNTALLGAYGGSRYMFPYLDYRVVDFAVSIPRYQYLRGKKYRYIFREAFKDLMPDSLYAFSSKEDPSDLSIKPDPDWYEKENKIWKETVKKLDRSFWGAYLDFDKLNEISNMEEPSGEKKIEFKNNLMTLFFFAMAQNMVEKSREVAV